jgi:uncharacterized membrane protein YdbT with pleckstrin-like domain
MPISMNRVDEYFAARRRQERRRRVERKQHMRHLLGSAGIVLLGVAVTVSLWPTMGWPAWCAGSCISTVLISLRD